MTINLRKSGRLIKLLILISVLAHSQTDYCQMINGNNEGGATNSFSKNLTPPSTAIPPDFQSDGCTMWFNGDYRNCCVEHDWAYAQHRAEASKNNNDNGWFRMRLRADNNLFLCVAAKKGLWHVPDALVMWLGVRIFASDWSPRHRGSRIYQISHQAFAFWQRNTRKEKFQSGDARLYVLPARADHFEPNH